MTLWIALHLHQLALEVFRPNWLDDTPAVVLEKDCVIALSASACVGRLQAGMRRGGVLMQLPQTVFYERALVKEEEALHHAALALLQFSPQVVQGGQDCLLVDVGASLTLFNGVRALCRRMLATVQALGFSAWLGCAPTARGAWLLARGGGARCLGRASLARQLDRLPPRLLPPAWPFVEWLDGIGCASLHTLRILPRPGLQRRCGKPLLTLLDRAYGDAPELFDWVVAPAEFKLKLELPDRVTQADDLLFFVQRLLLQLVGWLTHKQLAVLGIHLHLQHERGRQAVPPSTIAVNLAEASWQEPHLRRLLQEHLGRSTLAAPVIALTLEAVKLEPMAPANNLLFAEPGGTQQDHRRLIELLIARLGADNVLQAAPLADHRPAQADRWISVIEAGAAGKPARTASLPVNLRRPLWLLPKPVALGMRGHRPFYRSPLTLVTTPERIESGWWDGAAQLRDYFIAQGEDMAHYWIYRERAADLDGAAAHWFLHGLFA